MTLLSPQNIDGVLTGTIAHATAPPLGARQETDRPPTGKSPKESVAHTDAPLSVVRPETDTSLAGGLPESATMPNGMGQDALGVGKAQPMIKPYTGRSLSAVTNSTTGTYASQNASTLDQRQIESCIFALQNGFWILTGAEQKFK